MDITTDTDYPCDYCGTVWFTENDAWECSRDDRECQGHESLSGPMGITVFCDGTCR